MYFYSIIENIANIIDIFLNYVEALAIVFSFITIIFIMINKYLKGLKYIFKDKGIGSINMIKILFMCRKSLVKKRLFIEYAILKSKGKILTKKQWSSLIYAFKNYYELSNEDEYIYEIDNCTDLLDSELSKVIEKYFKFFSTEKNSKYFGISDSAISFIIVLSIKEAYITPTCLLSGLLSSYEENWKKLIDKFIATNYLNNTKINTTELFFTFDWLLWGPSYEIDYTNVWGGLCQLMYGDEANSIPCIVNSDNELKNKMVKYFDSKDNGYGILGETKLKIYEKNSYLKNVYLEINPTNKYFYDKIATNEMSFITSLDYIKQYTNYKSKKYYATAYVWVT